MWAGEGALMKCTKKGKAHTHTEHTGMDHKEEIAIPMRLLSKQNQLYIGDTLNTKTTKLKRFLEKGVLNNHGSQKLDLWKHWLWIQPDFNKWFKSTIAVYSVVDPAPQH
jgi:hypothetical protein